MIPLKINKLPSGTYRCRVYLGKDASGKPIQKSFTDKDKKRLQRIASEYLDRHRELLDRSELGNAIEAYIAAKEAVLSPKTIAGYISLLNTLKTRSRAFCALRLDDLNRRKLTDFVNDLINEDLSPKTIRNYIGLISATLKHNGYVPPVVDLPPMNRQQMTIPEESDIKQILDAAPEPLRIPIILGVLGLRRSEICALTVDDLDGNTLHVHSALVYDKDGNLVRKGTKTASSDRYVQIPADLAAQIRQQGYVTELTPTQISNRFQKLISRKNLPKCRFHDLRHFFVSYCHTVLKLSDAQIMKLGGWKTSHVMTSFYRHSLNDQQAAMLVSNSVSTFVSTRVN